MGGHRPTLPHAQLAAFIRNESAAATNALIDKLKQEDPGYQALFELIARCKPAEPLPRAQDFPQTFFELEDLLVRIYAGAARPEEAGQIIAGLLASPKFYQRLLAKLEAMSPQLAWEEAANLEDIVLKSDAEIFALVKGTMPQPYAFPLARPIKNFIAKLAEILQPEPEGVLAGGRLVAIGLGMKQALTQALDLIVRRPAYAFGVPLAVLAVSFVLFSKYGSDNRVPLYTYDQSPPYDIASGLRGPSTFSAEDSLLPIFKSQWDFALSDYVLRDYPATLQTLADLRPFAAAFYSAPDHGKYVTLLRDYFFYTGVSYFAWSRSERFEQTAQEKKQHAEQAVHWLMRADSLAQAHQMPNHDRETFFLGLAYGFAGREDKAVSLLRNISPASSFYKQSIERINAWFKP